MKVVMKAGMDGGANNTSREGVFTFDGCAILAIEQEI